MNKTPHNQEQLAAALRTLRAINLPPGIGYARFGRFGPLCIAACHELDITHPAQIAYIFATVAHETNGTFRPVREAYWLSESTLVRWLQRNHKRYLRGKWWGRGYIQVTWEKNYQTIDDAFGLKGQLMADPKLLLKDHALSVLATVAGMQHGWFTGHSLGDYINRNTLDLLGARRIVNGRDRADKIQKRAIQYLQDFSI